MHETLGSLSRMEAVQTPIIPVIGEMLRQTPDAISLGQGIVHYGPPPQAAEAARVATLRPETDQYQDGAGLPALLDRIARKLSAENGIDLARGSAAMVTSGANMAFVHSVLATTSPGDEVILPVPFYFNHDMAVQMAGCRVVRVPTDERYGLSVDSVARAIGSRTRAIVTVSPNNPSGAVYQEGALRRISEICRDRGLYHISDETYEYFTYGSARHVSPGSFAGAAGYTISLYSLSKAYGFAGWRIGYMAYPDHLAAAMSKIQDTILICPPIVSQAAAIAALDVGRSYCEPYVRELASIRDVVVGQLSELAPLATVPAADGAFYCLLRINDEALREAASRGRLSPMTIAERLIREHKVAVIPGPAFGITEGCYFRVAYGALQKETVTAGIGRLVKGLRAMLS